MAAPNIPRCLALLEKLKDPPIKDELLAAYYAEGIIICEKHLGYQTDQIEPKNRFNFDYGRFVAPSNRQQSWAFIQHVYVVLRHIVRAIGLEDSLIVTEQLSISQLNLVLHWIHLVADLYLVPNLSSKLLTNKVIASQMRASSKAQLDDDTRLEFLTSSVEFLSSVFLAKSIWKHDQMEITVLKYMAGLHSIQHDATGQKDEVVHLLDALFMHQPHKYIRFLFILKSTVALNREFHDQLHQDLLRRIQSPGGFAILCRLLLPISSIETDEENMKKSAVVVGIIARSGHTQEFYANMIGQIEEFTRTCLTSKPDGPYLIVCVSCLNKLYKLPDVKHERDRIERFFLVDFHHLAQPLDILTGIVILEHQELAASLQLVRTAFIGPALGTLPSKILVRYLPLLLQCHSQLSICTELQTTVTALTNRCLTNRENSELWEIVESLLLEEYPSDYLQLHPRLAFKWNGTVTCQIGDPTQRVFYNASDVLVSILKASNNNILLYNIFLHLLEQLNQCIESPDRSDLIDDMDEISLLVSKVFKRRIAVIGTLSELINYKPFHSQFNENPAAILTCLTNVLRKQITAMQIKRQHDSHEPIMLVILSIIRELLEKLQHRDDFRHFLAALKEYKSLTTDRAIINHIGGILVLLDEVTLPAEVVVESAFDAARSLCSESAPHLKVYGLVQFNKLVQNGTDPEVLAKRHAILAIAMDALRNDDSYVFLNCIRLLVSLVDLLEAEVLETMVTEFRVDDGELDVRLKVGEVIVKVTEQLGPLAIRYKDILINCFLLGATNPDNEIRTSSLANMATICRLLSYQVHHFFEELMQITHSTITTDAYVPARRAAIMVLAQLIQGFDRLQDFQEIMLPVYRALKYVQSNETDRQTLVHATNGLDRLSQHVNTFLTTGPPADREIQVLGVTSDKPTSNGSGKGRSMLHIV